MTRYLMAGLLVIFWSGAISSQQVPSGASDKPAPPPVPFAPCPDSDPCADPSRPWMRGAVEYICTMPDKVETKRAANPGKNVVPCGVCAHRCDPFNERAEETGGLAFDPKCSARCSPKGCTCKPPCDS